MARWIGFCAPGRKPIAELHLLAAQETVVKVYETPTMAGRTDVILANLDAMNDIIRQAVEAEIELPVESRDNMADLAASHERKMADYIRRGGRPASETEATDG